MPVIAGPNVARERIRPAPLGGRRAGLPEQLGQVTLAELEQRFIGAPDDGKDSFITKLGRQLAEPAVQCVEVGLRATDRR